MRVIAAACHNGLQMALDRSVRERTKHLLSLIRTYDGQPGGIPRGALEDAVGYLMSALVEAECHDNLAHLVAGPSGPYRQ